MFTKIAFFSPTVLVQGKPPQVPSSSQTSSRDRHPSAHPFRLTKIAFFSTNFMAGKPHGCHLRPTVTESSSSIVPFLNLNQNHLFSPQFQAREAPTGAVPHINRNSLFSPQIRPKITRKEPRGSLLDPIITCGERGGRSPKRGGRSPKREGKSPKRGGKSPKRGKPRPKVCVWGGLPSILSFFFFLTQ